MRQIYFLVKFDMQILRQEILKFRTKYNVKDN